MIKVSHMPPMQLHASKPAPTTAPPPATRDMFAELYVAGLFADAGWDVYFPKRDRGFDFIATKSVDGTIVVRPVQVKEIRPRCDSGADEASHKKTPRVA